ncbi:MAG: ParB/RepB/Spo0J family partition protein, partial [Planctomycetota bacterium]
CVLFRGDDKTLCGVAISTNEIRRDDDILTRAKKAGNLLAMGYTEKEIAKLFGVTYQSIGNWLAINDLDTKVKGLIKDGRLAATLAMKLAKIEKGKQLEAAQEYLDEKATAKKTGKRQKRNRSNPLNQKKMRGRKEIEALLKIFDAKHEGNYRDLIKWRGIDKKGRPRRGEAPRAPQQRRRTT